MDPAPSIAGQRGFAAWIPPTGGNRKGGIPGVAAKLLYKPEHYRY